MTDETSLDDEALAVHADALQQRGDPRGELIAHELAGHPIDLEPWLGASLAKQFAASGSRVERGFVFAKLSAYFVDASSFLVALLASPAAPYLRGVRVEGEPRWLTRVLAALADEPRPWLEQLAVVARHGEMPRAVLLDDPQVAALVGATPHLRVLDVAASRLAGAFVHPGVRELRVAGGNAIATLDGPAVESLDLAFQHGFGSDDRAAVLGELPRLTRLDLSRNEPGTDAPHWLGGRRDPFRFLLDHVPQLARLAALRVPAIMSEQQLHALQQALDRAPNLVEVTVARAYGPVGPIHHARAAITKPPAWPWPPLDDVHGRDALTITVPGDPYGEDVNLRGLVRVLEQRWATLPPDARAAWTELWEFLAELGWEDADGRDIVMTFPYATLVTAVESICRAGGAGGGDEEELPRWLDLRTQLRQHATADTVSIKRYWGW